MKQGQEIAYETGKEQSTYATASSADYDRHFFHLVAETFFPFYEAIRTVIISRIFLQF